MKRYLLPSNHNHTTRKFYRHSDDAFGLHYPPKPRSVWDILTALLLGVWLAILAMAYFDILWK
jgi:hypothetical protein